MEGNPDSEVEYEIVGDEEEHEELGGLAFELEVVNPVLEQADADAPEPMDVDDTEEQDMETETESEAMSFEENQEEPESSSESSGSDPDWWKTSEDLGISSVKHLFLLKHFEYCRVGEDRAAPQPREAIKSPNRAPGPHRKKATRSKKPMYLAYY
ncbi:hypothetical protein NL676_018158 [Syzygium grande]|nr:hypothetical protein NL676_018158 [Syzygium grande]